MKKVLIGFIAAAAMTSCIKREDSLATDQLTNLGKGTITGTIMAKSDYEGDTLANGAKDFNNLGTTGVEGLSVTASWNTNDLDPDNVNGEGMSSTSTTDADGNYSLSIDAVGGGTAVNVIIDGMASVDVMHRNSSRATVATYDTLANGDTDVNSPLTWDLMTESMTFHADSLGSTNFNVTVRKGETVYRNEEVIEAEETSTF